MNKKIIFVYRVACDEGKAPCVDGGMLSLAICKKQLRGIIANLQNDRKDVDFFLLGLKKSDILYYAKLREPLSAKEYYKEYKERKDSIFSLDLNDKLGRNNRFACIHPKDPIKNNCTNGCANSIHRDDLDLDNQWVLISDEFVYFGKEKKSFLDIYQKPGYTGLFPANREHKPAAPYEPREEAIYEKLHQDIMKLTGGYKKKLAESRLPFPPDAKCDCKAYALEYAEAKCVQKGAIERALQAKLEDVKGHCKYCKNRAS